MIFGILSNFGTLAKPWSVSLTYHIRSCWKRKKPHQISNCTFSRSNFLKKHYSPSDSTLRIFLQNPSRQRAAPYWEGLNPENLSPIGYSILLSNFEVYSPTSENAFESFVHPEQANLLSSYVGPRELVARKSCFSATLWPKICSSKTCQQPLARKREMRIIKAPFRASYSPGHGDKSNAKNSIKFWTSRYRNMASPLQQTHTQTFLPLFGRRA